jgi:aspartyl-tRNA(Asn)/glutamyl-tRNA(Gln) amidotransferase subunit C
MAQITIDDVKKLAELSKLELSEEELVSYKEEIEKILGFVEQLKTIDTKGVKETSQVSGLENTSRDDVIVDYGVSTDDLLANAPDSQDGYIKVRRVL